ncbi:hypothetical protein BY458DRAFT_504309 [Sporodiniella umbellata]|nr:hypothetical protein BY458DRAFT_504309 [Sporodiniella umbellata]
MTRLEAMHIYVESLLKVSAEAYTKNMGREEAQRIIHSFAIMRPSGEDTSDDGISDLDDTSIASEDEEEQNYLRTIRQRNTPTYNHRPPSVASTQTMVTAPGTPHQFPSLRRPSSSMSMSRRGLQMTGRDLLTNSFQEEEQHLMDGNPWAQHPIMKERNAKTPTTTSSVRLSSPSSRPYFRPGSSNSSSVTATPHNRPTFTPTSNHEPFQALGPATKRALELLQNEVVTLNERIDDLRKELVERDKHRLIQFNKSEKPKDKDNSCENDGWKWVIKAALKYAGVNFMTALILFLILYRIKSPIAYAILRQTNNALDPIKHSIKPN